METGSKEQLCSVSSDDDQSFPLEGFLVGTKRAGLINRKRT